MKITFFGLTISSSWGNGHATPYRALLRALGRRGHDVVFYEKDTHYYYSRRDFSACDYCRLELYPAWDEVRSQALRDAAESDAVVVGSFCPEGARIGDELLELARPLRVFYDLDTPVTLSRLAAGGVDYLRAEQISRYDLVLSFTGGEVLRRLEQDHGARRARPLYGCVDPDLYMRVAPRPEFSCELSYMGTYSPDRQHKLDALFLAPARRRPEVRFALAGALYPWDWEGRWPKNIRRFDHVAPAEHPAFYSSSRLTLNITRETMAQHGYCPSGRLFEAAACGAPVLSDEWAGLETFFRAGEEIFVVRSEADALAAMEMEDERLVAVARRARERTLDEHSGGRRAEELLAYLGEARATPVERAVQEAA